MSAKPQDVVPGSDDPGPANPTPLAWAFYKAWRSSGLTLETVGKRADLSTATVSAYINGTRGSGGQRRQQSTIVALARALRMDVDHTLGLAGLARQAGVIEAIQADAGLSRRDKEMLILLYEQRKR